MKWVTWCNYPNLKGALARYTYRGKLYQKVFHGPKKVALIDAQNWVISERKKKGIIFSKNGPRSSYKRKTNKLPVGVTHYYERRWPYRKYEHIAAYASIRGRQIRRSFSIKKYGLGEAINLAIATRKNFVVRLVHEINEANRRANNGNLQKG